MKLTHDLRVLLAILLVNLILSVAYLLFCRFRKKKRRNSSGLRFAVMLLCPVVGILFFFFGWLYYLIFFHRKVDLADVIFSKQRVKTHVKADEETERNLVPLEEAITVTDRMNARGLMMQVVRKDISHSLGTIALAMNSEDSEVAHYGASVLQGALNDFRREAERLTELIRRGERSLGSPEELLAPETARTEESNEETRVGEEKRQKGKSNRTDRMKAAKRTRKGEAETEAETEAKTDLTEVIGNERTLIADLNEVLRQHVLTSLEQESYVRRMNRMAELLRRHTAVSAEEMEMLCLRLLEIHDTEACAVWADRSAEEWPEALSSYTNRLRLYYQTGDRDRFAEEMRKLKASGVPVDHRTLEAIRVFAPAYDRQGREQIGTDGPKDETASAAACQPRQEETP